MKSFEFPSAARNATLYRKVYSKTDDHLLFSSAISLHVGDVGQMVGWSNLRSVAGGSGGVPTRLNTPDYVVLGAGGRSFGLAKDWIYDCAIVQLCNCANEEMRKWEYVEGRETCPALYSQGASRCL